MKINITVMLILVDIIINYSINCVERNRLKKLCNINNNYVCKGTPEMIQLDNYLGYL